MRSNNPLKFIFLAIYLYLFFTEGYRTLGPFHPIQGFLRIKGHKIEETRLMIKKFVRVIVESLLSATPTPVLAISAYFGDFFATYCQLTGVPLPEDVAERQSISLLPTLLAPES